MQNLYCIVKDHALFISHLQQPIMGQFPSGKMLSERQAGARGGGQSPPCSSIPSLYAGLSVSVNLFKKDPWKPIPSFHV